MELSSEGCRYRILKWLGEGFTSEVCLAERRDSRGLTAQIVALKILKSETRVHWMQREFAALQSIDSPHCVRAIAWENIPGRGCALVMDAIEGVTLDALGRSARVSPRQAREIARQLQEGIKALRAAGFCHGDVSPRNAMIDAAGRVRLVDLGLPADDEAPAATPAYAAPELWTGARRSWRTDLFSVGLIEIDLINGFRSVDLLDGADGALARASSPAAGNWLSPDPARREFASIDRDAKACAALAEMVQELLAARPALEATRFPARETAPRKTRSRAISAAAAIGFAIACSPLQASPRADAFARPAADATLDIRSSTWREIWLNGARVGFAPILGQRLQAGPHRLEWRSRTGRGEIRFVATSGAAIRLDERSLSNPNAR